MKKKNQEEITRFKATINAGIIVFFMNGVIGPPTKLLYEFIISFWWCANQQQQRHQQQNDYATNFQPISISNKMQWESVVFGASIKYSLIFIICIDHCSFLVAASLSQHHHLLKICLKRHGKKRDLCKPKRFVNTIKVCVCVEKFIASSTTQNKEKGTNDGRNANVNSPTDSRTQFTMVWFPRCDDHDDNDYDDYDDEVRQSAQAV